MNTELINIRRAIIITIFPYTTLFRSILKFLPKDVDYTGIDLSEDYIINARKAHPHQRFICANVAETLLLDKELFDTVFLIGVQHHLTDVEMEATLRFAW